MADIDARPADDDTLGRAGPEDALIDVDGDMVIPTELCGGPWSPDAQHGSAVAGILARAVESVETPVSMRPTRFTVDLLSPVPLRPMRATARLVKGGKRIAVIDAELHHGDRLAARASALLIRDGAHYTFPADAPAPAEPPIPPKPTGAVDEFAAVPIDRLPGFARAMDYERTRGTMQSGSPASAWMGLRCRLARGEDPTPFQLAAVVSDMGSGLGGWLPWDEYRTINADITLHLLRLPAIGPIGLDGEFRADPAGIGMSEAALFDDAGMFARMQSSTYIDLWPDGGRAQ